MINKKKLFKKNCISLLYLWSSLFLFSLGFITYEITFMHSMINAKGAEYKSGIDKLIQDGVWDNISEKEREVMFKYYNSNFTIKYNEMSNEDFLIAELDQKCFIGRDVYVDPIILILKIICIFTLPIVFLILIYRWIKWLLN